MTDDIDELKALIEKRDAQIVYLRAQLGLDADGVPFDGSIAEEWEVLQSGTLTE